MLMWSRALLASATAAALIGLAACGSAAPATPPPADPAATGGHEGGHGGHSAPGGPLELWAVQTSPLGVVVTDGSGQLVYRSDRDGNAPSVSNCTGDCTAMWQPVVADLANPPELLGVDEDQVGVLTRPDGGEQITLAGWPLYRHVEHSGMSSTEVNGTDGIWFAIRPDGQKAVPAG